MLGIHKNVPWLKSPYLITLYMKNGCRAAGAFQVSRAYRHTLLRDMRS
jgi:hypothetical protein